MIVRSRDYFTQGEPPSQALLAGVIGEFASSSARLKALREAYENKRAILRRSRSSGLPNNRLAHPFPRYIVTMASGYLIGKPIGYQSEQGQEAALDAVIAEYRRFDVDSVDAELAKDASIFGRGVELLFADENAKPNAATVSPECAFVVYDDTVKHKPMFGVYMTPKLSEDGKTEKINVFVYTDDMIYLFNKSSSLGGDAAFVSAEPHYFGQVPMVEYWNSDDERGDFEQVESLIDAYDTLQSDRVNDKQQAVDALLVLSGVILEKDASGRSAADQLREDKMIALPDSEANVSYVSKAMDESQNEVLKDSIKSDIHKFAMVPDLTDEQFAGNASGVAMKYKLLGFEQLMRIKERWFREALRERLRRFAAFLSLKGAPALDADSVTMTFTRSLPVNELETAQTVQTLSGIVPDELLLAQIPYVTDVGDALEKLKAQKTENVQLQKDAFGGFSDVKDEGGADDE